MSKRELKKLTEELEMLERLLKQVSNPRQRQLLLTRAFGLLAQIKEGAA